MIPTRRARVARLLAGLVSILPVGCGSAPPRFNYDAEVTAAETYRVGVGDVLQVSVWKNEQLTQRVRVRPDGYITMPLIGDVAAGGRTVDEIGQEIVGRASRFFTEAPVVAVEVAELHSYRVYVLGEVARPGEFTPVGHVTVLQSLALAGGFTRFAAPDEIMVVRKDARGTRRIPFPYDAVVRKGDLRANFVLRTGDTVVVP